MQSTGHKAYLFLRKTFRLSWAFLSAIPTLAALVDVLYFNNLVNSDFSKVFFRPSAQCSEIPSQTGDFSPTAAGRNYRYHYHVLLDQPIIGLPILVTLEAKAGKTLAGIQVAKDSKMPLNSQAIETLYSENKEAIKTVHIPVNFSAGASVSLDMYSNSDVQMETTECPFKVDAAYLHYY